MKIKLTIFLILVFLITGCDLLGGGGGDDIKKDIYVGTEGVKVDIYDLPYEVNENEEIPFIVRIENKGPYETRGRFVVSTEKDYMNIKGQGNFVLVDFSLSGKTIMNDFDDFEIFNIPLIAGTLDPLSELHETYISTYTCYEYQGLGYADVCIDTDPYEVADSDKSCSVQSSISLGEGQGGPVVIEKIEPKMLIQDNIIRPQFKIYIQNRGQGTVIQKGSVSQVCSRDSLNVATYNTLSLTEVEVSGKKLSAGQIECVPRYLQLRDEQDFVTCTVIESQGIPRTMLSYSSPLKIQIDYGYTEAITKEISIKKLLNY